jgi:predicted RecB family nuclease
MADYTKVDPAFAKLAKPAQRALMNAGIFTVKDLAKHTRAEVEKLHGIGPSAFPKLEAALEASRLRFREE